MLGEDISKALGGISDEMVEQAAWAYEKKNTARTVLFRVAAVAAAVAIFATAMLWPRKTEDGIVTAPGVLKVYAYDVTSGSSIYEMNSHELQENAIWNPYPWGIMLNCLYGLPIGLRVEEEELQGMEITMEVSVNYGEFYGDIYLEKYKEDPDQPVASLPSANLGKSFVIDNGETIFWSYLNDEKEQMRADKIYADIVIKADGHIVGYAVVEIGNSGQDNNMYVAKKRKAVYFPPVDGAFQNVTEEYVRQRIAEAKQN